VVEGIGSNLEEEPEDNVSSDSEVSLGLHDSDSESNDKEKDNDDDNVNNNKASIDASTTSAAGNRACYDKLIEMKEMAKEEEIFEEELVKLTVPLAIANNCLKNTPPNSTWIIYGLL